MKKLILNLIAFTSDVQEQNCLPRGARSSSLSFSLCFFYLQTRCELLRGRAFEPEYLTKSLSLPKRRRFISISRVSSVSAMGQVLDKLQGKDWRQRQIRKITDKVYDRVQNQSGKATLTFEELYITVLLVYNDLNKRLPGPHFDPPSKEEVRTLIQECDINLDGEIDREEFVSFIKRLTAGAFVTVSQGLILTLVVAPTVAMATKKATEGVPGVGKVVQKLPNSIYASIVTLAVVLFQKSLVESD